MNDIVFMKMMNGDDIVSTVLDEDEDCYFITFPMKFIYSKGSRFNSISIAIIPWVPFEEAMNSIFQIYKNNIITFLLAPDTLKADYQTRIEESKGNVTEKIQDLYDKLNADQKLNALFMANTSNNWMN